MSNDSDEKIVYKCFKKENGYLLSCSITLPQEMIIEYPVGLWSKPCSLLPDSKIFVFKELANAIFFKVENGGCSQLNHDVVIYECLAKNVKRLEVRAKLFNSSGPATIDWYRSFWQKTNSETRRSPLELQHIVMFCPSGTYGCDMLKPIREAVNHYAE
jgi:hypothetical protein